MDGSRRRRGETTRLAGSGRWKREFPNTEALVRTLCMIEVRQTVFWPHSKQWSRVVYGELLGGLVAIKSDHPSSWCVADVSKTLWELLLGYRLSQRQGHMQLDGAIGEAWRDDRLTRDSPKRREHTRERNSWRPWKSDMSSLSVDWLWVSSVEHGREVAAHCRQGCSRWPPTSRDRQWLDIHLSSMIHTFTHTFSSTTQFTHELSAISYYSGVL